MAIEKTVFTGTTMAARKAEVAAWLTENTTDLFDSINNSATAIACVIDGVTAVNFGLYTGSSTKNFVCLKNAATISCGDTPAVDSAPAYAVRTSNGIFIHCPQRATNQYDSMDVFVSKSVLGTVVIAAKLFTASSKTTFCIGDFERSASWATVEISKVFEGSNVSFKGELTSFAPAVAADTYCDGLYLTPVSQYPSSDLQISAGGILYYSNGTFALKE